ncbi:hypothetical protein OIO90_005273 [Microbotryomycetes sp. JL221]|nr:hypothetical protein OIO90_005273 [Microbotryomycetes sp. JL221]
MMPSSSDMKPARSSETTLKLGNSPTPAPWLAVLSTSTEAKEVCSNHGCANSVVAVDRALETALRIQAQTMSTNELVARRVKPGLPENPKRTKNKTKKSNSPKKPSKNNPTKKSSKTTTKRTTTTRNSTKTTFKGGSGPIKVLPTNNMPQTPVKGTGHHPGPTGARPTGTAPFTRTI